MTKLTDKERKAFEEIIGQDMREIQTAMVKQLTILWENAREEILRETGKTALIKKKEELQKQKSEIEEEIHQIEKKLKKENLSAREAGEFGGTVDRYGEVCGASFHHFNINCKLDYLIAKRIKSKVDTEAPAKFLHDLARSSFRELTMVGTFEEAIKVYEKLYSFNFRNYGVDIPPRLEEMKEKGLDVISSENTGLLQLESKEKPKKEKKSAYV